MSLKDQLIKLGSENPELRDHIRPVLDSLSEKEENLRVSRTLQVSMGDVENMAFKTSEKHGWAFDHSEEAPDGRVLFFKWKDKGMVQIDVLKKGTPGISEHILIGMSHHPPDQMGKRPMINMECETERECKKALERGFKEVKSRTASRTSSSRQKEAQIFKLDKRSDTEIVYNMFSNFLQVGMGGEWWSGEIREGRNTLHHKKEDVDPAYKPVEVEVKEKDDKYVFHISGGFGNKAKVELGFF